MSIKRQTAWSVLPLVVITLLNFFSVPIYYRSLGPELYALWLYVIAFTGAFGFVDLGLGVAVGRYIGVALGRQDSIAVREYWGTGNAIGLPLLAMMGAVFATIGVVFGPRWFNVSPAHADLLRWTFVAGGVSLFLSYYCQFWLILSQAHLEFRFLALLRTALVIVHMIPSFVLAYLTKNPLVLVSWSIAVSVAQLVIFVWHARHRYQIGLNLRQAGWHRVKEMSAYTAKTFSTLVAGSLFASIDRLVLGKLAPPADFAHYAICSNAGSRINGISVAVMGPVFSHSSRGVGSGSQDRVAAVYDETFSFTFPWFLLISAWTLLWHPIVLTLWLGRDLAAAVSPIFVPIIVGCCITAIANISAAQLGPLNRVGVSLFFTVFTGLLLVLGVYFGWRWYGIMGVAWGFLFSRVGLICQDLFVIRLIKARGWLAAETWKDVAVFAFITAVFSICLFILPRSSAFSLIPAALHGLVLTFWINRSRIMDLFSRAARSRPAA